MFGKIHEVYSSISGEGISQGIPTVFIRFAGCSLRCGKTETRALWCDTAYALGPNQGEEKTLESVWNDLEKLDPHHGYQVLLTGGEPLEGKNRDLSTALAKQIYEHRMNVGRPYPASRVETNGSERITEDSFFIFTMDYKLPGSGMEDRMDQENFRILEKRHNSLDEIKFVVRDRIDFDRSIEVIREQKYRQIYCIRQSTVKWMPKNLLNGSK